jgi:hypothetical protein
MRSKIDVTSWIGRDPSQSIHKAYVQYNITTRQTQFNSIQFFIIYVPSQHLQGHLLPYTTQLFVHMLYILTGSYTTNQTCFVYLCTAFTLVSWVAYFSTLKMEAKCSSEISVDFQRTTDRHIPEDGTLHNHRCENLKYYNQVFIESL